MSMIYDNWERLVDAVLKKQELWELFHARSPSLLSQASSSDPSSSTFDLSGLIHDYNVDFSGAGSSSRSVPKLVLLSSFSPALDVEDVLLDSAELLGRGTFGSAYTASMENGLKIVVRRLNSSSVSERNFKSYMEIVGHVSHENVAPLRAYYSSKDERLMLYDYYSRGSVYELLHGQTGKNRVHVDWETRMVIAIGAARGIAEIHSHIDGSLVHGNIKSSNIFLNSQHYGCVSDFGLAGMIEKTFTTAHCYAPEVKSTRNISQASDVYSFGILIPELLTRKSTTHVPGGPEVVNLVKLVRSVKSKERAATVFDADLLKHPTISGKMVEVLEIGMRCTEKSIKKRPKMFEVVKMLEDISPSSPTTLASKEKNLLFLDNANLTFNLYDVLRARTEELAEGTFGSSYKAFLANGNTIVVKKLKDIIITGEDFKHHMEVIGRITHENLAELRAFFFAKDNTCLVYDFYRQGSLSTLLHGSLGTSRTALDWKTRLKIAVGAARGIAHIHSQDGGKFVHGNIKSSNIFLNTQKYGIVSDFGMAKMISSVRRSGSLSSGYTAPEVTDTSGMSQASDVYSFGVVLFELISGRPPQHTTGDGKVVSLAKWVLSNVYEEWAAEVFDVELLGYQDDHAESMLRLLHIAVSCVRNVPEHRPRMAAVVKMMEKIGGIEQPNDPRLEYTKTLSIESRLEYLLHDLLPTLRP